MKKDKNKSQKIWNQSKFLLKLFGIPTAIWMSLSIMVTIESQNDPDALTWNESITTDIFVIVSWFILSIIITKVINKIRKVKTKEEIGKQEKKELVDPTIKDSIKDEYKTWKPSKFLLKLFIIPSVLLILLSLIITLGSQNGLDKITLEELIIINIDTILSWLIMSIIITLIVNKIKKYKTTEISKKSRKRIIIIVGIYIGSFIIMIVGLLLTAVNTKINIATPKEFIEIMEGVGCTINYDKNEYTKNDIVTDDNSCPYLVRYTEFSNREVKEIYFKDLVTDVDYNNSNINLRTSVYIFEHENYVTQGDYYKQAVVEKNIVIYARTSREQSEKLEKIMGKIVSYEINWNYFPITVIAIILSMLLTIFLILSKIFGIVHKKVDKDNKSCDN